MSGRLDDLPVRHVYRWDLDKTYLATEFDTIRDLVKTALQKPEEKLNVPGAVSLLRELTRPTNEGRAFLTFVSGSPSQMRPALERKFELDGIRPDRFVLKPTLENILKGRFRAVRGQVGYKLSTLLKLRREGPSAPESMFGDDAEQDAFIYSLYADVSGGKVDLETLREVLVAAEVYAVTIEEIMERASVVDAYDNVGRIFINLDRRSPPGRFWPFGPRVVPIVNYFQAALILYGDGVLAAESLLRVARGMAKRDDYGVVELSNSFQDLMRRRHLGQAVLERLSNEPDWTGDFEERLLDRARALAPKQSAENESRVQRVPDYLEILRSDRGVREALQ
jgi:hypothetical protein